MGRLLHIALLSEPLTSANLHVFRIRFLCVMLLYELAPKCIHCIALAIPIISVDWNKAYFLQSPYVSASIPL